MISMLLLFTGKGACFGLMGGVMGGIESDRWATFSVAHRSNLQRGALQRSVLIGGLASGALILSSYFHGAEQVDRQFTLTCITISFVLSSLYVAGWLRLVTEFGSRFVETREMGLLAALVVFGLLYVFGILWATLVVICGCVVIALAILGGLRIYRFR